jgi:DNA-binding NarL/FixJ family response regulator
MKGLKPILLVEDDQMDFMQLDRALHEMKIVNPLIHKKCGAEALQYLTDDNNDRPCLIISIPVVVLTMSRDKEDIIESFELGVADYLNKPIDRQKFIDAVKTANLSWDLADKTVGSEDYAKYEV